MTSDRHSGYDVGHPAPHRGAIGALRMWFALLGGFAAWSVQLGANAAVTGLSCASPLRDARPMPDLSTVLPPVIGLTVAALVVSAVALFVSLGNLRRTRHETAHESGDVMMAGEGRTRFLAVWSVWISMLFLIANGASLISALWGGLCQS
ncbi:MAG: hypothetical protein ACU0AT_11985 [Tranquillimonas sp.]|jgi:hypothetical protein